MSLGKQGRPRVQVQPMSAVVSVGFGVSFPVQMRQKLPPSDVQMAGKRLDPGILPVVRARLGQTASRLDWVTKATVSALCRSTHAAVSLVKATICGSIESRLTRSR